MNNREYDKFFELVRLRVPIAELRSKYDAKLVAVRLRAHLGLVFSSLNLYSLSMEWLKDYMTYIFDEGKFDVNECYPGTSLTSLDFAILYVSGSIVNVVVDFLLARGARPWNTMHTFGFHRYHKHHGYNDFLFKRLFDAGAAPPFEGIPSQLYHFRRATRSVCTALLSLPWKLPLGQGVRQWLPRDVLRVVAQMIWSQRFEYKGRV